MNKSRALRAAPACALAASLALPAAGFAQPATSPAEINVQSFPTRPIRLVVPFPPGSASDFLGRQLGQLLGEVYKTPVVTDNRPGAGGLIGSQIIIGALPDGHTLGLVGAPHFVSALLQPKPPYRPIEDVTMITQVATIPNLLTIAPTIPAKTVQEFVAYARARPGELNYASLGVGSFAHTAGEIFRTATGLKVVHVPFKSIADVNAELVAGRIHFLIFTAPSSQVLIGEGRGRALAVSTAKRNPAFPDLPTFAEAGFPAATNDAWFGIIAPPALPKPLATKIYGDINRVLKAPETRERFARQGADPTFESTPESFLAMMKSEYARYTKLVKEFGAPAQ
ncbi:MAG: tripartite tricarboxylate transporter substrate binding protein [Proteobacteria bacterium]|nr:tripartite tricarboxylate transporter substrate binding protein [Burkholderiales bacterium]